MIQALSVGEPVVNPAVSFGGARKTVRKGWRRRSEVGED